ncbi:MAG: type I-B CRISPR-associated protein Cas8b1/Cst1 [Chloroflexi bacterium AL-W]|nr:type I-B CRISPR-associated protein Cas8b1/Cst1 [Chloroflexi bacterium AL-N1]NOK68494.1 type I-B CRISPR-associated protein Cas8b1/Cst1 [Chloroflexi bacterium AL-N10]NOK74140.1 type I-B CRISPR-associated protein Cas8b1/Cst1 [Chloroflexi bacterium AL-N5]NOK83107.1 type I-B CRISPR-associated protein Cas8b1/Cst1 [Chloroflexi bacterium AL-W]NOK90630.1 type I-B CRISPR-associated protein Cas8b1/Cst1 [Chloroflexi bacterium AL-N15]
MSDEQPLLSYTGHPFVDVGLATILAFREKTDIATLNDEDMIAVAEYIEQNYTVQPLKSFLNVAFMNSGFTQTAFEKQPEKRQIYAHKVAREYANVQDSAGERCVFTGESASAVSWSVDDSLVMGRAFREHISLLNGRDVINFVSGGDAGIAVSGKALLCIQFFPIGCAKCGGRLLAVHSDNLDLMWDFANKFFQANRSAILQAQTTGSSKLPEAPHSARTLLIKTFLAIETKRLDAIAEEEPAAITAYHLSNSGQSNPLDDRSPPLAIYHLPLQITVFLATVSGGEYKQQWNEIAKRAWQRPPQPKKKGQIRGDEPFTPRYNRLYEDLFRLPDNARFFVSAHFLRVPRRNVSTDDPTRYYTLADDAYLVSWKLVKLFLKEVIRMSETRIEEIRAMGDRLADYVFRMDDRRFFRSFFRENRAFEFRTHLIKANMSAIKAGMPPLFTLDPYTKVFHLDLFEDGTETLRVDWKFARDLVLIRMIEQLYNNGWIGKNPDLVAEAAEPITDEQDEENR